MLQTLYVIATAVGFFYGSSVLIGGLVDGDWLAIIAGVVLVAIGITGGWMMLWLHTGRVPPPWMRMKQ